MGIVTIAIGDTFYGELAFNLALSVKLSNPDVPITVISDGAYESVYQSGLYVDNIISVPKGQNPFEIKTRIYELSPYKHTLYIDADTVLLHNHDITPFLKGLEAVKFAMIQKGPYSINGKGSTIWANIPDVYDHYNLDTSKSLYPVYNSSLIYFTKSANNRKFFKQANKNYHNPCKHNSIGKYFPDEVPIGAASAQLNHYSEITEWRPCYFQWYGSTPNEVAAASKKYPFLSLAGARQPDAIKTLYNGTAGKNVQSIGMSNYHYLYNHQKKTAFGN